MVLGGRMFIFNLQLNVSTVDLSKNSKTPKHNPSVIEIRELDRTIVNSSAVLKYI
jgi:hypothetical protein